MPVFKTPCGNKSCPCYDGSESGCNTHSIYVVDLCDDFVSADYVKNLENTVAALAAANIALVKGARSCLS